MSRKRSRGQQVAVAKPTLEGEVLTGQGAAGAQAFTFGDPVPVLDGREVWDYLECWANGRWYEPPVSLDGLARSTKASVYLQSELNFRRNMLVRTCRPHRLLSRGIRAVRHGLGLVWQWQCLSREEGQHAAPGDGPAAGAG